MFKKAIFAAVALAVASASFAGDNTPRLDQREANQKARIQQGVRSGELTRPEARRLAAGQVHLRNAEARAKADGEVTRAERARLQHKADKQSRRIYRQKHDAQDRN